MKPMDVKNQYLADYNGISFNEVGDHVRILKFSNVFGKKVYT